MIFIGGRKMITYKINRHDTEVKIGDYWTMHSPANKFFPDSTWIMRIRRIQENDLVPVDYVNWKRKGHGISNSRMLEDFGDMENLKPSTDEEIAYFEKRFR